MTDLTVNTFQELDNSVSFANDLRQLKTPSEINDSVEYTESQTVSQKIAPATQLQGVRREYPTLRKLDSNPSFTQADQSAVSIYWPWLCDGFQDGITNKYCIVYSTDHASHSASGSYLATADTPFGPWTQHGRIFRDDVTGGSQHETPSLIWDEINNRWLHYYQLQTVPSFTNQLTMVATAPSILKADGTPEDWTIIGVAATEEYLQNAGDGHSGYLKPFRFDGGWYAHALYGGTDNSRRAFYVSKDNGLTYRQSTNIMQSEQHLISHLEGFDPSNWLVRHPQGAHIIYNNQLWLICDVGGAASGGVDVPIGKLCAFRVGSDGVTLGRAVDITPPLQAWEDPTFGVDSLGSAVMYNNKMYVTYRQAGGTGGFGIMEVE